MTTAGAAAGLTRPARRFEAGGHHPYRSQRPRPFDPRRGNHPGLAEFGGRPAHRIQGRACDDDRAAGRFDLLDVEKRNVKHFEVETPYLAAIVKGTHFRVSVNAASTSVGVLRGQVEVDDFKSGQVAQVMPGQTATAAANGKPGLSLSGSGTFNPIEQGKPRASSVLRITAPKAGTRRPAQRGERPIRSRARPSCLLAGSQRSAGHASGKPGVTRISTALGEVRLDFHKITHGLARGFDRCPARPEARQAGTE